MNPSAESRQRVPWLTGIVCIVTVAFSIAALLSPALMRLMIRDPPRLQGGQWWRTVTPVLVQADGWGQLLFNLLGIAVVGAAVERRMSMPAWALTYTLGGVGSVIILSVLKPHTTGAGSSDAVAALVGALAILVATEKHAAVRPRTSIRRGDRLGVDLVAQLYCVFFALYLTAMDLGGLWWAIVVGNASIVAFAVAHRALDPTTISRASLVIVGFAGVIMTTQQDGHGIGIIAGTGVALLTRLRHRRAVAAPPAG